jgi:o-succinylbenzoate synthase
MLHVSYKKHTLIFKRPGGTSRGVLSTKDSWFIKVWHGEGSDIVGIGECSIINGLSPDPVERLEEKLKELVSNINNYFEVDLSEFPSISFGLETALLDLASGGKRILFPSSFTNGEKSIPINGLIWMGAFDFMRQQIIEKLEAGFDCIKLKIGAIDFKQELQLLKMIRKDFSENELELRVDANGAFKPEEALEKLKQLSDYRIHSIEQPIRQNQWQEMAALCEQSPIDIALDEELIGLDDAMIPEMLDAVQPQYIILKPSLVGGFKRSEYFISEAEKRNIGWWVTSALESNIGLNAIAQWTATLNNTMPQGLGTGQLFTNNIDSPLEIINANLKYNPKASWGSLEMITA